MTDDERAHTARIEAECIIERGEWPSEEVLQNTCTRAVNAVADHLGITGTHSVAILFTDNAGMKNLNTRFRGKDEPTNVLSFPAPAPAMLSRSSPFLGDIALGFETIAHEAESEGKRFHDHLSHLVVHGVLHLLGYDHESSEEAEEMENLEKRILESLAIEDPYA